MSRFHISKGRYRAPNDSRYAQYIKQSVIGGTDDKAVDTHDQNLPDAHGSYGALILHPNWKAKRKEILQRDQHQCRHCGSSTDLQVHHRQYLFVKATQQFKVPWDYPDHLLLTLCAKCHSRGHALYKVPSFLI